jgi:4-amino-4-deoxy-L-arabinose transferase-like glycosyltransferase
MWDYPLLLPLSIVRSWSYMGGENSLIPALIAFVFTFLTLGLLVAALALLKGRAPGYLAAMILMGSPFFIFMGASQFADIPFAFFMLATLVMLLIGMREENPAGPLILAGIAAGLCAWTKNEGLLFVAIVAGSFLLTPLFTGGRRPALRRIGPFLAGALPILLMVLYFKTSLAPAGYLVSGFTLSALSEKWSDWGRYAEIARAFFITGISFTQGLIDVRVGMHLNPGAVNILLLIGYLFLAGVRIDRRDRTGVIQSATILCLMAAGYFFIYVLTPLDLGYHLATSLNRLFLQLWPGVIFLLFMAAGTLEEEPAAGMGTETIPPPMKSIPAKGKQRQKIPEVVK